MVAAHTCSIWTVALISKYNLIISIRDREYCPGVPLNTNFYIGSPDYHRNYL